MSQRWLILSLLLLSGLTTGCQWNRTSEPSAFDDPKFTDWERGGGEDDKESERPRLFNPKTWFSADTQPTGLSAQSRDIEKRLNVGRGDSAFPMR